MTRAAAVACLLSFCAAAPGGAQDEQVVEGRELVALGFFQDFEELDLASLLVADDVTLAVASHRALGVDDAPGIVSVIEARRMRETGARRLEDVIRLLPEFDIQVDRLGRRRIVARGFPGDTASSENVLVLLNGHRLSEELSGGAGVVNLAFPTDLLQRVEVWRGPGTALWGPGALAATINLVTWNPSDLPQGFVLTGGYGSFDTKELTLQVASSYKGLEVAGFIVFSDTDGSRRIVPEDNQSRLDAASPDLEPISLAPGPVSDDLQYLEVFYGVQLEGFALDMRLKQETGGGFVGPLDALGEQNDINSRQLTLDARKDWKLDNGVALRGCLAWTRNDVRELLELFSFAPGLSVDVPGGIFVLDQKVPVLLSTSLNSARYTAALDADWSRDGHELVAGISLAHEGTRSLEATSNLDLTLIPEVDDPADLILALRNDLEPVEGYLSDQGRGIFGLFVQDSYRFDSPGVTLTGGLRLDHAGDVGSQLSPRLAAVWDLPRGLKLKTLYGRAHRLPSFTELYFDSPLHRGNPELATPTSDSIDVGLSHVGEELTLRGNVFLSFLHDPIVPDTPPSLRDPAPLVNGDGRRVLGLSLEASRDFGLHEGFAYLTLLEAQDSGTDAATAGVPTLLGQLGATFLIEERYALTPRFTFRSSRPRAPGDARDELGGYLTLDISFEARQVTPNLDLRATIRNLFGSDYADPSPVLGVPHDYPRPGFSLLVHASYRF